LFADDEIFNIVFLKAQLSTMEDVTGRCDFATDGEIAVSLVRKSLERYLDECDSEGRGAKGCLYSLLVLDYSMPNLEGPEVARKVTEAYEEYRLKLIEKRPMQFGEEDRILPLPAMVCLTGFQDTSYQDTATKNGFIEFLVKPVALETLKRLTQEYAK